MNNGKISEEITKKIAKLSDLTVDGSKEQELTAQFNETLSTIEILNKLDTENTVGTFSVTGSENIYREDIIDEERVLTQEAALSNAKNISNGYFVVEAVLDEK